MRGWGACALAVVAATAADLTAQDHNAWGNDPAPTYVRGSSTVAAPILEAVRVQDAEISLDGIFNEDAWNGAAIATGFVQFQPDEGDEASERTEARVLYGDNAIYVAIRAFDSDASAIVGQLTRRDQGSHSDLVGVVIDSYFDRRTAFHFAVNPVGVKHDIYRFDDTNEDSGWDAVWDVATSVDSEGWNAEFEIPYSQLRFRDESGDQTWGINFLRDIARNGETAVWAPTSRSESAIVSRFGELRGLRGLSAPNRMEIQPYSLARLRRAPGDADNPFYRENDTFGTAGGDIKYGVTSNLTLDVTINPDFGQVEADPAQVNLTALETFLPERRPFFLEGSSIFNFGIALGDGDGANESLFYSRRVGRSPQGRANPNGGYVDAAEQATILGAWKLSGKTSGGWSIGAMHALTSQEVATVAPGTGEPYDEAIEPLSNYGVLRVQKDFRDGRSAVGFIGTGMIRDGGVANDLELRSKAFSGGVDFRHRFANDTWSVNAYILGSTVRGSQEAIARTQRSPARYYQRPDADHVEYDPTRTALSGTSANVGISKNAGSPWRFGTGVQTRSSGFEVNDIGFMNSADFTTHWLWTGYHLTTPIGPFRSLFVNSNAWHNYNYEGERTGLGGNINMNMQFRNFWNAWMGVNRNAEGLSSGMLRGGPMFRREAQTNFWAGFGTDGRKAVQVNMNTFGNVRPDSDSWTLGFSPNVRLRPSGRATFNLGSFVNRSVNDMQWVRRIDTTEPNYVFGRIEQTTVGMTARIDYAFTPTLSLQVYAQPFLSAGSYGDFKRVAEPNAANYSDRIEGLSTLLDGSTYRADVDGDGSQEAFGNPDFNVRQFRSNAVLRWEYRPGSSLFIVWSQGRNGFEPTGGFDFGQNMGDLFSAAADDVFMVKFSYWLSR